MMFFVRNLIFVYIFSLCYADLVRPLDGENLNFLHIVFEWEQEPDAVSYNLQILNDNSIILDITSNDNVYIEKNLINWSEDYSWKVRPIYFNNEYGPWINIFDFNIADSQFPIINAEIYNQGLIQDGLVAFSGFAPELSSAIIDIYGNEIWNTGGDIEEDGSIGFMLNYINEFGNIYGLSIYDYPNNTGTKANYDLDFIWSAPTPDPEYSVDIHEFKQIPNGNYMGFVPDYQLGPIAQGDWSFIYQSIGYQADGVTQEYPWIGMKIVEWDQEGNEVWAWDPFEHFSMDDHDLYGGIWWDFNAGAHDWMHSNAFHFDEEESVIYVSHRHLSRISKIAYPSGEVIWNIGMAAEYNTGADNICTDLGSSFQHNIQLLEDGTLLFFDNGNLSQMLMGDEYPTSRIRRIQVIDNSYCETVWEYELPSNLFGLGMGSVQLLDNGNYFIYTFGSGLNQGEPTLREVTPDYEVVWNYQGVNNAAWYRTYTIPSLHPDAFSVIAENFISMQDQSETVNVINLENTLNFNLTNKSGYTNQYKYMLSDLMDGSEQLFSFQEGVVELGPYQDTLISFSPNNNSQTYTSILLSIWPINHEYSNKELFYNVRIVSLSGDLNNDGEVNVIDVVQLVNFVLSNEYNAMGDLNNDTNLNVLDVVTLVNIILE